MLGPPPLHIHPPAGARLISHKRELLPLNGCTLAGVFETPPRSTSAHHTEQPSAGRVTWSI